MRPRPRLHETAHQRRTGEIMNDDAYFEPPAHEVFGPQGVHVAALIERARHLTLDEARALAPVRDAAMDAALGGAWAAARGGALGGAWSAARGAAWAAARGAARGAAWDATDAALAAAWDAAGALVVRDILTTEDYDTLTRAWRTTIGPLHPDDPDMRGDAP